MKNDTIHNISFSVSHISALMIGLCCAINAYVYISISALPVSVIALTSIPCALSGFILNYILYITEHNKFENTIRVAMSEPKKLFRIEYVISMLSGIFIALFSYDSWQQLLTYPSIKTLMIPSYFPLVSSVAYGIGTFILLGRSLIGENDGGIKDSEWYKILDKTYNQLKSDFTSPNSLDAFKKVVGFSVIVIALYTLISNTYLPAALGMLSMTGPVAIQLCIALVSSIAFAEIIFNIEAIGGYLGIQYQNNSADDNSVTTPENAEEKEKNHKPNKEPTPAKYAPEHYLTIGLILFNALGNGLIGLGGAGTNIIYLACGLLMSAVVMRNSMITPDGTFSISRHINEIRKSSGSDFIIPATWATIIVTWMMPAIRFSAINTGITAGIASLSYLIGNKLFCPYSTFGEDSAPLQASQIVREENPSSKNIERQEINQRVVKGQPQI